MKKSLLIFTAILAVITFSNYRAHAQILTSAGPVQVNIVLSDVYSIVLGTGDQSVTFDYTDAADYAADQLVTKNNHFTVISNKPYSITVEGNNDFTNGGNTIPLETVVVNVASPTTPGGTVAANVALSTDPETLITGADPTTTTAFNIDYQIPEDNTVNLLNKAVGTYTANVTYRITQP